MGYVQTIIVTYGVRLNPDESKMVYDKLNEDELVIDGQMVYDTDDCQQVLSMVHRDRNYYRYRYRPTLLSEETDSRIHSNFYEPYYDHVFGLHIASKGYAYDDTIEDFMESNEITEDNFNKYCKPILDELDIEYGDPQILIVSQVW